MRTWRWDGRPVGLFLVRATVSVCVLMVPLAVRNLAARPKPDSWPGMGPERAAIVKQLNSLAAPQLVLVRYKPEHDTLFEWVYNEADIDHSKLIWARDMGSRDNAELLRYYHERQVWLLEADDAPPKLEPYWEASSDSQSLANNISPANRVARRTE